MNGKTNNKKTSVKGGNSGKKNARTRRSNDYNKDNIPSTNRYGDGRNDVAWYAQDSALLRSAAAIPFSRALGSRIDIDGGFTIGALVDNGNPAYGSIYNATFPGICVLDVMPLPGISNSEVSAFNIAMRNIYASIRKGVKHTTSYDPADVVIYVSALDELYSWYYNVVRVYGLLNQNNKQNRYVPRYLVEALGFDYDDLSTNMLDFYGDILKWGTRIGMLAVPSTFATFERHKQMFSFLYQDGTAAKAQTYAFRPWGYRKFVETAAGMPGYLQTVKHKYITSADGPHDASTALYNRAEINQVFAQMLDPLLGSDTSWEISGDLLQAYNTAPLEVLRPTADYIVTPVYNAQILEQIHNATILPYNVIETSLNISQDVSINGGFMLCDPQWPVGNKVSPIGFAIKDTEKTNVFIPSTLKQILSLDLNDATPEDIVEATRLMNIPVLADYDDWQAGAIENPHIKLQHCGAEICLGAQVYTIGQDGTTLYEDRILANTMWDNESTNAAMLETMRNTSLISYFKYAPRSVAWQIEFYPVSKDFQVLSYPYCEVDTFAIIDEEDLGAIHDVCVMSLLGIPQESFTKGV